MSTSAVGEINVSAFFGRVKTEMTAMEGRGEQLAPGVGMVVMRDTVVPGIGLATTASCVRVALLPRNAVSAELGTDLRSETDKLRSMLRNPLDSFLESKSRSDVTNADSFLGTGRPSDMLLAFSARGYFPKEFNERVLVNPADASVQLASLRRSNDVVRFGDPPSGWNPGEILGSLSDGLAAVDPGVVEKFLGGAPLFRGPNLYNSHVCLTPRESGVISLRVYPLFHDIEGETTIVPIIPDEQAAKNSIRFLLSLAQLAA